MHEDKEKQCLLYLKVNCLNRLFWIKKNQENYSDAFTYLSKIDEVIPKITSEIKSINYKISNRLNKAQIKRVLEMEEESIKILKTILEEAKTFNDTPYFDENVKLLNSHLYNALGKSYLILGNKTNNYSLLDSANLYYKKSYDVTQTFTPKHPNSKLYYYFRKTEVLIAQKKFNEALKLINDYKKVNNGTKYKHREFFQKAICFHNLKKSDSAIFYSYKIINHKKDKCSRSNLITLYDILSKEYNSLNKQDSAYKYSSKTLNQYSLAKEKKEKTYQLLYKNDLKEAEELNKTLALKKQNSNYTILLFATPLIGILTIITFFYRKEKKRNNKLFKKLNETRKIVNQENNIVKKEYNIDDKLENEILSKLIEVEKNLEFLKPDFSINKLASELQTNSTYISFVFNNKKEESFKQYYTKLKIDYIKDKLKNDSTFRKYSIQTLAEEVGYSNASAFSRAFKKFTGTTPSKFLKTLE